MSVMAYSLRRATIATFCVAAVVFLLWLLPRLLNPTPPDAEERERDKHWVNTSPNWVDRQTCRWLGLCGIQHIRWDAPALPDNDAPSTWDELKSLALGLSTFWTFGEKAGFSDWEAAPGMDRKYRFQTDSPGSARILEEVPDYVLEHAPLVHLYSDEHFWPSDIVEHVRHLEPFVRGALVNTSQPLGLGDLASLNNQNGTVFLTSKDDVEHRPDWLHSRVAIPVPFADDGLDGGDGEDDGSRDPPGRPEDDNSWRDVDKDHPPHRIVPPRESSQRHTGLRRRRSLSNAQRPLGGSISEDTNKNNTNPEGYSQAPAVLILVDKGAGILDAFWFFFYSYNLGQTVLKIRFGNHVGDWEHCMVRFQHGVPRAMFLSEHAGGKAYLWKALEKRAQKNGKPARPVIYSAVGSHAMYASPGMHPYVLPFKLLKDITDKGPLWDPALNKYAYWYDYEMDRDEQGNSTVQELTSLIPAASNPDLPTSWFHFEGSWGDDIYPLSDERQWRLFGEYHYITGPLGPKAKWLDRRKVCQTEKCTIVDSIEAGKKSAWY